MFRKTDVIAEYTKQATELLIKDLIVAFNKKIKEKGLEELKVRQEKERSVPLFNPGNNYYPASQYMQDRISHFIENKDKAGLLKSLKSQAEYLIHLLKNCGPYDQGYFSTEEVLELCANHSAMIVFYGDSDAQAKNTLRRSQSFCG